MLGFMSSCQQRRVVFFLHLNFLQSFKARRTTDEDRGMFNNWRRPFELVASSIAALVRRLVIAEVIFCGLSGPF